MFWTDWGSEPKIERSNMDGSSRSKIVHHRLLYWPNGLTIDTEADRLFWTDAKMGVIETSDLDGNGRKKISHQSKQGDDDDDNDDFDDDDEGG